MENQKTLKILLLCSALMLCFAVIPVLPYSYYILLRGLVCFTGAFTAYCLDRVGVLRGHVLPLILLALLFNPVMPIHLSPSLWVFIDLGTSVYFLSLSKKII